MARILDGNSDPILDDVSAADTLAALGDSLTLELTGQAGAAIALTDVGASVLTVTFEASVDGANFFPYLGTNQATGVQEGTATGNGLWGFHTSGLARLRARITAWTSGSIKADGKAGQGAGPAAFSGAVSIAPTPIDVDANLGGTVSANNSTNTPLGIGGVFLGTSDDVIDQAVVIVSVRADQASATDGLQIEYSPDNVTWYVSDNYTINANALKTFTFQPVMRYVRVRYTNGAVGQGSFDLQVQFRQVAVKPSSHRVQESISDEDDATLSKGVLAGRQADGTYDNVGMDTTGSLNIAFGDGANLDAFSRLRTSEPATVFDSTFEYDVQPFLYSSVLAGGGTVAHSPNNASAVMAVAGSGGDSAILQSKAYHRYIPGKSQLVIVTSVVGSAAANVRKRVGYFDADNGIFLEQNGTTDVAFVRRTNTSGAPVDNRVVQANWNIDPLDGTGRSGITLDLSKANIMVFELQWLGMGRVRVGFDIDGRIYMAHQFLNANNLATVYMRTANLPIRWEITENGGVGVGSMLATCSSVQSEGGSQYFAGFHQAYDRASVTAGSGTQTYAFSVRAKSTFNGLTNRMLLKLFKMKLLVTGSNPVLMELYYGGNVGGAPAWVDMDANYSGMQVDTAGTPSGGVKVASLFTAATNQSEGAVAEDLAAKYPLSLDQAGTGWGAAAPYQYYTVYVTGLGGTSACRPGIEWEEVR